MQKTVVILTLYNANCEYKIMQLLFDRLMFGMRLSSM